MKDGTPVYIGSIVLERNRWAEGRKPSYRVSEWAPRFAQAGFDGIELWQNHALFAPPEEQEALASLPCPVRIFNSYAGFEQDDTWEMRRYAIAFTRRYRATGVKFNVFGPPEEWNARMRVLRDWAAQLPADCVPLCECHGGSMLEKHDDARRFFEEAGLERWGVIVHAMSGTAEELQPWVHDFGSSIRHVHVSVGTESRAALCRERANLLRKGGFRGSLTIEFTQGVGGPEEDREKLFASAVADMQLVREAFAEAA